MNSHCLAPDHSSAPFCYAKQILDIIVNISPLRNVPRDDILIMLQIKVYYIPNGDIYRVLKHNSKKALMRMVTKYLELFHKKLFKICCISLL